MFAIFVEGNAVYGEVILSRDGASGVVCLTLFWRDWLDPNASPLTDDQVTRQVNAVPTFLGTRTRTTAQWRETYMPQLKQVAALVASPDLLNTALSLAVQHYQLPSDQQKARADFINAGLSAEFEDVLTERDAWEPLQALLDKMGVRALLMPQALLAHTIREACLEVRLQIINAAGYYQDALPDSYVAPYKWLQKLAQAPCWDVVAACSVAIWTRKAKDRLAFVDQLERLLQNGRIDIVRTAWSCVQNKRALNQQILVGDFIANLVREAAAADLTATEVEGLLSAHWQLLQHSHVTMIERGVLDALAAGIAPVGEPGHDPSFGLSRLLDEWAEMERSPLSAPSPRSVEPPLTLSADPATGSAEDDGVYAARCQVKTLGWLQGPIAARNAPKVAVNELAQRELASETPPARVLTKRARAAKRDMAKAQQAKVASVQDTMQVALLETAHFMAAELSDGLVAANAAGVAGASVQQATRCAKSLDSLRTAPVTAVNFPDLQQKLFDAEQAVAQLHAAIRDSRKLQGEERMVQRLLGCLCNALSLETLALGKRHGGVIQFEASPADWGWIARRLHRRCLLSVTRVIVGDRSVALGTGHALGLYVTQSSRSGTQFAFDISVHLWRRHKGCKSSPCGESLMSDPFPPFNETDWFDTLAPCAVLHLPRKS